MRAGDIVRVDFGLPEGSEPGFERPAIVVTADVVLEMLPRTVHVVPITSNVLRRMPTEVELRDVDLPLNSVAQAHLCSLVSITRVRDDPGSTTSVGPVILAQVRSVVADLLDL